MTPRDSRVILGKEAGRQGKMAKARWAEEKPLAAYAHVRAGDRYHGQLSLPVSSNTLEYISHWDLQIPLITSVPQQYGFLPTANTILEGMTLHFCRLLFSK